MVITTDLSKSCEDYHGLSTAELSLPFGTEVIALVGATATGKTDLALDLATRLGGEIVNEDIKVMRSGMGIASAAPTLDQLEQVRHHMVGVFNPGDIVPRFILRNMTKACVKDVVLRDRTPIVVGGSIPLMESLVYQYEPRPIDEETISRLRRSSEQELMTYCTDHLDIGLPFEISKRRLYSHIVGRLAMRRDMAIPPPMGTLVLGVRRSPEELEERIRIRTAQMMASGLKDEVAALIARCDGFWIDQTKNTIGIGDFHPNVNKGLTPEESIIRRTLQLAEWQTAEIANRIPHVQWVESIEQALELVFGNRGAINAAMGRAVPS